MPNTCASTPNGDLAISLKLYIERRDGMIRVQQKVNSRLPETREMFRSLKVVEDTPENLKDILRWADVVGHTIEEKRSE